MATIRRFARPARWDLVLPLAALAVAAALVLLALAASRARSERRALALEGRLSRLAHGVEITLREADPGAAQETLARTLRESSALLAGLALVDPDGRVEARAGDPDGAGVQEVILFLGPAWHRAAPGGRGRWAGPGPAPGLSDRLDRPGGGRLGRGRRVLRMAPAAGALRSPWSERLLLPVVLVAAVGLVALAVVGGRLLVRRQRETLLEADRQRLEGLARAGAGLAHQLRTPLATIKGSAQLLQEAEPAEPDPRLLRILEQAARMDHLLGDLLDYARPSNAEPRRVSVAEVAGELGALEPRLRLRDGGGLSVTADPDHLRQILENLVENAVAADPDGGPVELAARQAGDAVEVTVADRGPGPGGDPDRHFEPYVTGRAGGTGLGLPIARSLARANGGDVTLAARPGGGTVAALHLPGALRRR